MPLPRLVLALAALLLAAPTAAALSTRQDAVDIAWQAAHAPAIIAAGALHLEGGLRGGLIAAHPSAWTMRAATLLVDNGSAEESYRDATLHVSGGTLLWKLDNETPLAADVTAPYALGIALQDAPSGVGSGAILVGSISTNASWRGPETQLILENATIIIESAGAPVPGWQGRLVNPDAHGDNLPAGGTLFRTSGAVTAQGDAEALGAGTAAATMTIATAAHDGFADTVQAASQLGDVLGGSQQKGSPFGADSPLQNLEAFSPMLNGGVMIVGADAQKTPTLRSQFGADAFDIGPFTLMRSKDLAIAWKDGETKLQGSPTLVINKQGAAVPSAASAFGVPILGLVLWVAALAAVVLFLVRRPEKVKVPWTWRLIGWSAWAVAFLIAFLVWDASFAATFGSSFLTQVREHGVSLATLQSASLILGIELIPWTLASLLFALPIRIVLGVGFRYLGKGAAYKGFAKAGGVLSLALFAPLYGLFLVNGAVMLGLRFAG